MITQENNIEFDFSKAVTKPIKQFEKQSFKKVFFLAIGISVFTTLGFSLKDMIENHFANQNLLEQKTLNIGVQDIKNMSNEDFASMLLYIMKNSDIYDEKVQYIQTIVAKAEVEDYQNSMSTDNAASLGKTLDNYKKTLLDDISQLSSIKKNVTNGLPVTQDDCELFLKYKTDFNTKSLIRSKDLEDQMQELLYSKSIGNNKYNTKHNVYDSIKQLDQKINNSFNTVVINDPPKPKI